MESRSDCQIYLLTSGSMGEWAKATLAWTTWLRAAGRPPTTLYLREYQLRRFAADLDDPWTVTADQVTEWLARPNWSRETRRSYRAALRSFYTWAHTTGRIEKNPTALLPPIKPTVPTPRPTPRPVVVGALEQADDRTRLMVLLAVQQGLRRGEISRVHSTDIVEDLVGWSLLVHGKGGKSRTVPLADDVAEALRQRPAGWVFPGRSGGHLSPAYVGKVISRLLGSGWTAHTLRHRFATSAYAGQRDLFAVQTLLGHASPETTRRYVQLPDEALRTAVSAAQIGA